MPLAASADAAYRRLRHRRGAALAALAFALLCLLAADILTGPAGITPQSLLRILASPHTQNEAQAIIVWQIRLPQALLAVAIGAALGLAGAEMQTVLDNPLASPYTLGVSSAAALGAALALVAGLRLPGVPDAYAVTAAAFVFTLGCTALLDLVARRSGLGSTGIILLGIALVFSFNAILSLIQLAANASALQELIFWMMGSLSRASWPGLSAMTLVLIAVSAWSLRDAWRLSALRFGPERATAFGVDVRRIRRRALLRISLLTAMAVSLVGTIGFVGLVAPHIARSLWGEDHRWYLPASALTGGIILSAASIIAKVLSPQTIIPVGIVTTLVGIPVFIFAIVRRREVQP